MTTAEEIAKLLLEIKAVTLNVKEPFRYTSGILAPIYCDNRLVISYPEKRKRVIDGLLELINDNKLKFDIVAGTATAGIPHAAWLSDRLDKPMVYVRGSTKEHGKQNRIEGKIEAGKTALVVEDLISTGGSAVSAGLALREEDMDVNDCVAIFSYQMEKAAESFFDNDINLHTLTNFTTLLEVAVKENYIDEKEREEALAWNENPAEWRKAEQGHPAA